MFKYGWFSCMLAVFSICYSAPLDSYLITFNILYGGWQYLLNILIIIGQNILNLQCFNLILFEPCRHNTVQIWLHFFYFSIHLCCRIQLLQGESVAIIFMKVILLQSPLQNVARSQVSRYNNYCLRILFKLQHWLKWYSHHF